VDDKPEALRELALFAGAGGGILAGQLLGWRTVCAVEYDEFARCVLVARQNDGAFEPFPIWDDVRTFDGAPWRGRVDVVSGGFPCQDISTAGRGAGITGERSGLWVEMARIVGEVQPRFVFVENSPALTARGLGRVLGDLASLGFDAEWGVLGAADVGAPHQRDRIWILAHSNVKSGRAEPQQPSSSFWESRDKSSRCRDASDVAHTNRMREPQPQGCQQDERGWPCHGGKAAVDNPDCTHGERNERAQRVHQEHTNIDSPGWWDSEPELGRVAYGLAHRTHRLKAIGNGQVPACAAEAFRRLMERIA
jgi:DNA (cytosine-5)-methyltransferase 1